MSKKSMRGSNPIRPPEKGDGSELYVQNIFSTIQGEGPFAGQPAIFVRLGGCNLACEFCDTEFESFTLEKIDYILKNIKEKSKSNIGGLIVITGGEPFRQPIELLCSQLLEAGYQVQIETNGTLYRPVDKRVSIVCSPKNPTGQYTKLRPDILEHATALKFLISKSNTNYSNVPDVGQEKTSQPIPIYLQPMDEYDLKKNKENQQLTMELAQKHGYNISLQLHKILGIE